MTTNKAKVLLAAALSLALPLGLSADAPTWLGVVDSPSDYKILRSENNTITTVNQSRMTRVGSGDRIVSSTEPLLVRLSDGNAVLVAIDSEVELKNFQTVRLEEGSVAFGYSTGSTVTVEFDELGVSSVENPGEVQVVQISGAESGLIAMERLSADRIRLTTINDTAFVRNTKSGALVAIVAANGALDVVRNRAGQWVSVGNPFNAQDGGVPAVTDPDALPPQDDDDPAAAGLLRSAAIVGGGIILLGGAGAGTYIVLRNNDIIWNKGDDDDDDDETRRFVSPLRGTPTPYPTPSLD